MSIQFSQVSKRYGALDVIKHLDITINKGEFVALVGPSGCGKSTLLHMLAGLESMSDGKILVDGTKVQHPHPSRTLVFQEHALYPWLTLQDNVALALEFQKVPKPEARKKASQWLEKVQLAGFDHFYPHQVSGGMLQRAALARAFIAQPDILLMDEPFGALDALTRMTLQDELRRLIDEIHPTVLLVTHDVDEALFLADRILVFSKRPARVLEDISLKHLPKSHDLSDFAEERRKILALLGVSLTANQTDNTLSTNPTEPLEKVS